MLNLLFWTFYDATVIILLSFDEIHDVMWEPGIKYFMLIAFKHSRWNSQYIIWNTNYEQFQSLSTMHCLIIINCLICLFIVIFYFFWEYVILMKTYVELYEIC